MKTTILLFALVVGCITPTYSQLNRQRKVDAPTPQLQNKKNDEFGNYKFFDKFNGALSDRAPDSFNMWPTRPSPSPREMYSRDNMPCFHPKSGDAMPCFNPTGKFHMRIFKPKDYIWGILW